MTAPTLTTERLVLRPLSFADHAGYLSFVTSERARYMGGPHEPDVAWQWLTNDTAQWLLQGFGGLAITRDGGDMIGQVSVTKGVDFPEPELGWFLLDGFEGQGFATEAAASLKAHVLANRLVDTLVSYIDPDNHASARIAERLGATRSPHSATPAGETTDVWRYALPERAAA